MIAFARLLLLTILAGPMTGASEAKPTPFGHVDAETVKGIYSVDNVQQTPEASFVWFRAYASTAKIPKFFIEIEPNKMDFPKGFTAQILTDVKFNTEKNAFEADQVFIDLTGPVESSKFWLLGKKRKAPDFSKSNLLKQHGTRNDYWVF